MTELVTISVTLPADLMEILRERAALNDRSVSAEMRIALRAYLTQPLPSSAA